MVEGKTHEEITHEKLVTRLSRLRNAASEAVLWDDRDKLVHVAKAFTCLTPTKRAIAETGVGHLLANKTVWVKGGDVALSLAKKALTDWKEKVKHTVCDRQLTVTGRRTLVTMNARLYMDYVNDLVDWLKTGDEVPVDPVCSKKLAATLVQHGILHRKHLDSIDPESLQVLHPAQAALLRRATAQATQCGRNVRPMLQGCGIEKAQFSCTTCSNTVGCRNKSALAVARQMSQSMVAQAQEKWSLEFHQHCGDVLGSGPKNTIRKLAAARQNTEITQLLEERASLLRVECKKGSLSSVVSGLHAWHAFATDILGYSVNETLPPKRDVDICKFLAIFRNLGTAANYDWVY